MKVGFGSKAADHSTGQHLSSLFLRCRSKASVRSVAHLPATQNVCIRHAAESQPCVGDSTEPPIVSIRGPLFSGRNWAWRGSRANEQCLVARRPCPPSQRRAVRKGPEAAVSVSEVGSHHTTSLQTIRVIASIGFAGRPRGASADGLIGRLSPHRLVWLPYSKALQERDQI
jgi:hypothetical protein